MSSYLVVGIWFSLFSSVGLISGGWLKVSGVVYLVEYNLLEVSGMEVGYEVSIDWVSCSFIGVVFFISSMVIVYCEDYSKGDGNGWRFLMIMVLFVSSSLFMVFSGGLVSSLLGWDSLGLVSYILVIYYQSSGSYKSGSITVSSNRVGDVLILLSIGLLMKEGTWSFMMMGDLNVGGVVIMLMFGACTKSAQLPFSAWLPEASAAPTPVSSLVHSSTLVTAGVFSSIRLEGLLGSSAVASELLCLAGVLTSLMAGLAAMVESDMKKVVASSTLSQLGFSSFSLSKGFWVYVYFHMVSHALFKALMFMGVGMMLHEGGGNQDGRFMGGGGVSFIANQGVLVSVLCLGGFPFFCGFFSKDLLLEEYLSSGKAVSESVMFTVGFGLSVFYGLRLYFMSMVEFYGGQVIFGAGEKVFMNIGVGSSSVVSVVGGGFYGWLEEMGNIILGGMFKMMGVVVLSVGIFVMVKWSGGSSLGGDFLGGSWNFSSLSGGVWVGLVEMGEEVGGDGEWVEEMGGGGMGQSFGGLSWIGDSSGMNWIMGSMSMSIIFVMMIIYWEGLCFHIDWGWEW